MSSAATIRTKVTIRRLRTSPAMTADTNRQTQIKAPEHAPGLLISGLRRRQVRVRIRIMKLSKLSSATCIQASNSLR